MSGSLLIKNTHLLHPEAGALTGPGWLEAVDGRIAATGTGRPPASSDRDRRVIDAKGATALPGLIDAHVHLLLTTLRFHEIADWAPSYMTARAFGEAGRMLRRGFTTVRDVGGADWGMARAIQEGLVQGPRLVFGGKALTQTGGHGDMRGRSDNSRPCCEIGPGFARIADGVDAVRAAARDEFRKGARHLKVLLSGGVASPHDEVSSVQYTEEEIGAAVAEAANHNRYVTVHAYHPRGIDLALRAGARCVEHGNLINDETVQLLLDKDAFLVPTLITYDMMARFGKQHGMSEVAYGKIADVREAGLGALERAHRAGVQVVYGSDLLGPLCDHQLEEFTLRAQIVPAADLIRSATTTAARLLGMDGLIGTLAVGAHADLLIVDGDPLDDIGVLTRPREKLRHVVKGGSVVV
ncbi:amidohydrolase family protein [Streptomyces sp. NPDC092295]|uniref:metal-dependent hydrolase family protein n=1 Tax=Streptomyces sp. NPDC092295 TaxID=3366011 RepID=UPI00381FC059